MRQMILSVLDSTWEAKLSNIIERILLLLRSNVTIFAVVSRHIHHAQINKLLQYSKLGFIELETLARARLTRLDLESDVRTLLRIAAVPQRLLCRIKHTIFSSAGDRYTIRVQIMHSQTIGSGDRSDISFV